MAGNYLSRWEPFRDLLSLRTDFDRLFNTFFGRWPENANESWAPVVDIAETDGHIKVKAELPGMKKEDLKVTVKDSTLYISGERKQEEETKDKTYHRIERSYGRFCRTLSLPIEVDADKIKASYKDGILLVTLPKQESLKPKDIEVEVE